MCKVAVTSHGQGCGQKWNLPLLHILDMSVLFRSSVEEGLRETIRVAESLAPAVLWIDELEKALFREEEMLMRSDLSDLMQEKPSPFAVATANDVRSLPPELLRKRPF